MQGCPISGNLFVLCIDPLLRAIQELPSFRRGLEVAACADDIGASVSRLEHLAPLRPLFAKIEKFANLKLGLPKCVVIPTFGPATDARRAAFLHDLARIAPDWERFGVKSEAKYLGWRIGPRSAKEAWSDALTNIWTGWR